MMTGHKKAPVVAGALKRRRSVSNGLEIQKLARKKDGGQYKSSDWDRQLQAWKDTSIATECSFARDDVELLFKIVSQAKRSKSCPYVLIKR
tara:strand:+ start:287 stop:559 length:273 start_codon:yes stop_codon:yes gene_type:complete